MKKLLFALLCAPMLAFAATGLHLDPWPGSVRDQASLKNGAKLFTTYCLNCHSASFIRYQKLFDIGFTEEEMRSEGMISPDAKIGDLMMVSGRAAEQKTWFGGVAPPDLTVVIRARGEAGAPKAGSDFVYTYLRSFYRDPERPTGWNNPTFANVGMPHPLWELQGQATMDAEGNLTLVKQGSMSPEEYDKAVSDIVAFMTWMAEPQQLERQTIGVVVLLFLVVLFVFSYALKKNYWRDVH